MLEEAFTMAYRKGPWKYIAPTQEEQPWIREIKNIEGGISTEPQLYHLENDSSEQTNLAQQNPEIVNELKLLLEKTINKTKRQQ